MSRCEWYEPGRVEWRGGVPRLGDPVFCLMPALPDVEPGRCARHAGLVTDRDRAELAEIERDKERTRG